MPENFYHHQTWKAWNEGVADNCSLCIWIQEQFGLKINNLLEGDYSSWINSDLNSVLNIDNTSSRKLNPTCFWSKGYDDFPALILSCEGQEFHRLWERSDFDLFEVRPGHDRLEVAGYEPTVYTNSKACFELAKHWLRTCEMKHTKCERPRTEGEKSWKPTRLIRIYEDNDDRQLFEGEEIPDEVTYATLSHCWGKIEDKLVLTLENRDDLKQAIPPFGGLKTFEDAVNIARQLGLWYLWIDSLCIVQNSKEDWLAQSAQMSNVYKYSFCNITATSATSDLEGCFFNRSLNQVYLNPLYIDFTDDLSSNSLDEPHLIIAVPSRKDSPRSLEGRYELLQKGAIWAWREDITLAAVNRRAWVVQERLLAPRVLHFSKTQLYWECAELQASESFPFGQPMEQESDYKAQTSFATEAKQYMAGDSTDAQVASEARKLAFSTWGHAVRAFTSAELTYNSDKLIAISAIAREMKLLMKCRYLAGHWETDLIHQLAWIGLPPGGGYRQPSTSTQSGGLPDEYCAPSWSWASSNQCIDIFRQMSNDPLKPALAEVIAVQIELSTDDEMGQVKGGYVKLRGHMVEFQLGSVREEDLSKMYVTLDNDDAGDTLEISALSSVFPHKTIWFMPIEAEGSPPYPMLTCLAIDKVEDQIGTFRRIGTALWYSPTKEEAGDLEGPDLINRGITLTDIKII
ncbi:uncharacterized protein BP5553_00003 [Venustampulla echinocandica]|uniref:Heterokaryon incompatibility domain-containing protein n=1 Tax=Venustampulla echinocandica TaxID=2656787 RepID=A0A370TWW3_9HELO|nr:uncharacterized protein BP5553_00003 [Venustampulla echinocandica]RDL40024.1 hypothetical protein BP5553_00003 [Venustampulla echinocandica]